MCGYLVPHIHLPSTDLALCGIDITTADEEISLTLDRERQDFRLVVHKVRALVVAVVVPLPASRLLIIASCSPSVRAFCHDCFLPAKTCALFRGASQSDDCSPTQFDPRC